MLRFENKKKITAAVSSLAIVLAILQPLIAEAAYSDTSKSATSKSASAKSITSKSNKSLLPGLLKQAQNLLEQDKNSAALALLNSLITKEPNNALAYNERARTYGRLASYSLALEDCNKAIALSPRLPLAYAYRAAIYIVTARYDEALSDSNKALAINPKFAMAYSMKALVYERLKAYQKEVDECNKAIAIDAKTYRYYVFRASALNQLGQHQKALQDCNTALSLNSKKSDSYIQRGHTYCCLGKFQKAIDDCSAAIKINPVSGDAYRLRASAFCKLGQYQKGIDDLTAAIKIAPKQADLYARRACVLHDLGQLQSTIIDCAEATELNPNLLEAYCSSAAAYEELGLYDKAIKPRTKLVELNANDCFNWSNRARIYELLGKFDLAQADRQKAFSLATLNEQANMQLCAPLADFNASVVSDGEGLNDKISNQLKNGPVVLPFHYDDGGHIVLPVQVNGHPLELMLDSGCGHSDLWKAAMPGVASEDKLRLQGSHANGQKFNHGFFRARDLKLGNLILANVMMGVNKGLEGHKTLGGFLAGNILEHFVVTIDYAKKEVLLASSAEKNFSQRAIIVPMIVRSHRPYCMVKLDGKLDLVALLDTGCPTNLSADALLKPVLSGKLSFPEHMSGPWLGELSSESVRLKSLQVGELKLEAPIIDVFPAAQAADAAAELVLGNSFLSQFRSVTFDYLTRRVIFEPYESATRTAPSLYCEGRYFQAHHQDELAVRAYSEAVELEREYAVGCYHSRSQIYMKQGKYEQVILDCDALIKLDPRDPWVLCHRAWAYGSLGNKRQEKFVVNDVV
ncbi:hypothetical protein BH11CYA1_BH11CYA1_45160 [soil metagenome]